MHWSRVSVFVPLFCLSPLKNGWWRVISNVHCFISRYRIFCSYGDITLFLAMKVCHGGVDGYSCICVLLNAIFLTLWKWRYIQTCVIRQLCNLFPCVVWHWFSMSIWPFSMCFILFNPPPCLFRLNISLPGFNVSWIPVNRITFLKIPNLYLGAYLRPQLLYLKVYRFFQVKCPLGGDKIKIT